MDTARPALFALTPEAAWRWGVGALWAGLVLGLLLVAYLAWFAPEALPVIPALLLVGVAGWHLFRRPVLNLVVVLAAVVLVLQRVDGLQLQEVAYGLYFLSFLAYWFITRLLVYGEAREVLSTTEARALFLFLVLVTLSIPLSPLFGGQLRQVLSEWVSLALLGLYFPVKELVRRHRYGPQLVLGVIAWVGLFVALRNMVNYQQILINATQEWQVVKGRVTANDTLLAVPSLFALPLLIYARRWKSQLVLLGAFLLFFSGLILTQSRGYWLAFLFGAFLMLLAVDRRHKIRLVGLGVFGLAAVAAIGALFLSDYFFVVIDALVARFASIGSSTSRDISLVNRLYESAAVWEWIKDNPILGHGMATKYYFYDITFRFTRVDFFIHNGYLSLWFKFGIWGLGLMLVAWFGAAWRGLQAFRAAHAPMLVRLIGLGAAMGLMALALAANTSNPLVHTDSCFILSVTAGVASGAYLRGRDEEVTAEAERS